MTIVQDNTLVVIMHISGLLHSCVCLLVEKKIVLSLGVIALHRNENFVAVFAPVQISVPSSSSSRSNVGFGIFPIKNGSWKDTTGTTATNVSAFAVKTLGNVRGICTTVDSFNFSHLSPIPTGEQIHLPHALYFACTYKNTPKIIASFS